MSIWRQLGRCPVEIGGGDRGDDAVHVLHDEERVDDADRCALDQFHDRRRDTPAELLPGNPMMTTSPQAAAVLIFFTRMMYDLSTRGRE